MPTLAKHKTALRDYEVLESFEAALVLSGSEVKSLRAGKGVLQGAYVIVRGGEVYIQGMQIPPYQPNNTKDSYEPTRVRKLLLTKQELATVGNYDGKKGYTIIPLSIFTKGKRIKVEIAAVRGKKKHDKRQNIKARQHQRDIEREMKEKL